MCITRETAKGNNSSKGKTGRQNPTLRLKRSTHSSACSHLCHQTMKRHQFTTIEEVQVAQDLLRTAVQVAQRHQGFYKIQLFQSGSSYLEVYRHAHFNVIIKVKRFTDTAYLAPYLEEISADALFS